MQFIPYAFIPFGVLLVTALTGAVISTWIALTTGPALRRPVAVACSAEIFVFPASKSRRPEGEPSPSGQSDPERTAAVRQIPAVPWRKLASRKMPFTVAPRNTYCKVHKVSAIIGDDHAKNCKVTTCAGK